MSCSGTLNSGRYPNWINSIYSRRTWQIGGLSQPDRTNTDREFVASDVEEFSSNNRMIPPLEGDLRAPSNEELLSRGYPPRPDPEKAPARYARWQKLVSQPFSMASPRLVKHSDVCFAPPKPVINIEVPTIPLPPLVAKSIFNSKTSTWSRAFLTQPTGQFWWVEADWTVPGVLPFPKNE